MKDKENLVKAWGHIFYISRKESPRKVTENALFALEIFIFL